MKKLAEIALFSSNMQQVKQFYARILGVKPTWEDQNAAEFALGGVRLFLHARMEPLPGGPPSHDHIALEVDDVDDACEKLKSSGTHVAIEPRDYYWGQSAYFHDPDGRLVELWQRAKRST